MKFLTYSKGGDIYMVYVDCLFVTDDDASLPQEISGPGFLATYNNCSEIISSNKRVTNSLYTCTDTNNKTIASNFTHALLWLYPNRFVARNTVINCSDTLSVENSMHTPLRGGPGSITI